MQPNSSNNDREDRNATHIFNPETLLDAFFLPIQKFWQHVRRVAYFVMSELGGYEIFDAVALWCVRNPHIALCLLAAGVVFVLPFLIIFGFGIATMVMTFTGILVLEGTLLTVVSMMFFACLGGLAIGVMFFAVVAAAAYFGFAHIYGYYGDMERLKRAVWKFVQNQGPKKPQPVAQAQTNGASNVETIESNA